MLKQNMIELGDRRGTFNKSREKKQLFPKRIQKE